MYFLGGWFNLKWEGITAGELGETCDKTELCAHMKKSADMCIVFYGRCLILCEPLPGNSKLAREEL